MVFEKQISVSHDLRIQKRTIMRKAMQAMADVSSAYLHSVKPGSKSTTLQAGTLTQVLMKDTATKLGQQVITLPRTDDGAAISFRLPTFETVKGASNVFGLQVSLNRLFYGLHTRRSHLHNVTNLKLFFNCTFYSFYI